MRKLLLLLCLLPSILLAQDREYISAKNITLDASEGLQFCSGTGDITIATGCGSNTPTSTFTIDKSAQTIDFGDLSFAGNIQFTTDGVITTNTADSSDTLCNSLLGAGTSFDRNRSGQVRVCGEEATGGGDVIIEPGAGDTVQFLSGSSHTLIAEIGGGGTVLNTALTFTADNTINGSTGANLGYKTTTGFHDFYIDGTRRIRIKTASIEPETDDAIDLGTATVQFKDAYFDGLVRTDELKIDGAPTSQGVLCALVDGTVGQCTSVVGAGGTCTCA